MRARITRLTLTDFRSYRHAELAAEGRSCVLSGPNGAGKTNLLEAISLFSPGRGLRGAAAGELGRQAPGEAAVAWASAIEVTLADGASVRLGTGVETAGGRRLARIDGQPAHISAFAEHVRPLWLTPAHDRLFTGPAGERRRFLDRLTFSGHAGHAADVAAYEHALRERLRLLAAGRADPVWLDALEAKAAESGVRLAGARAATIDALAGEIEARRDGPFPVASLALAGDWVRLAEAGEGPALEARLAADLAASRRRDAAAGRSLCGPHRVDLAVFDRRSGRPAAQASTGEQKALILNLILAQAARLSRAISVPNPVLLLDEVAAHLDADRRAALFDEIEALSLQTFLTGADGTLFDSLAGRALVVRVDDSRLTVLD